MGKRKGPGGERIEKGKEKGSGKRKQGKGKRTGKREFGGEGRGKGRGGMGGGLRVGVRFWGSNLERRRAAFAAARYSSYCSTLSCAEGLVVEEGLRVPLGGATGCLMPRRGVWKGNVNWPPLVLDADELSKMLFKHVVEDRLGVRAHGAEVLQLFVPVVPEVR